jgi:hypothetical protein
VSTTRKIKTPNSTAVALAAVEAAEALVKERSAALAAAEQEIARIHRAWEEGDDSPTADDEDRAEREAKRLRVLLAVAERQLTQAKRAVPNDDVRLAEALVAPVADALRIAPSVATTRPTSATVPSVYIVQTRPATADLRTGSLSGSVDVVLVRTGLHRDLDVAALCDAASSHGVTLRSTPLVIADNNGDVVTEVARLDVSEAFPALPMLSAGVAEGNAAELGRHLVRALFTASSYTLPIDAPRGPMDNGRRTGITASAESRVVEERDEHGKRLVTVETVVKAHPTARGSRWDLRTIGAEIASAADALVGNAIPGAGRVERASVVQQEMQEEGALIRADGGHSVHLSGAMTNTGYVRSAVLSTAVRFVVASRLADGQPYASTPESSSVPAAQRKADPRLSDEHGGLRGSHPGLRS